MSGVKQTTVRIPQRELRNLRNRANRADAERSQRNAADRARRAEERRRRTLEGQLAQEQDRQARIERHVQGLEAGQRQIEANLNRQLAQHREELRRTDRDIRRTFQRAMNEQERRLRTEIQAVAETIQRRHVHAADVAARWLELADAEIALAEAFERHELHAPGAVAELRARRGLAANNCAEELSQAALAQAQEVWLQGRILRDRLELAEAAWGRAHQQANAATDSAEQALARTRHQQLELDDQDAFEVDVDHWSEGAWGQANAEIEAQRDRLDDSDATPSLEDLERMAQRATAIEAELEPMAARAQDAVLASVVRHDMQSAMLERLEDLGYVLQDSTWEGEDQRRALHQRLRNASGDEIVVVVTPQDGEQGLQADVQINFVDNSPNGQVRRERLAKVREAIRDDVGAELDGFREQPGFEGDVNAPAERLDLDRVRAQRGRQP